MPKYLNVDSLVPDKKVLTIQGVDHEMRQVTVKEFLELVRTEKGENELMDENTPIDVRIVGLVEQIKKAFPTVPEDHLTSLRIEQLAAVIKFTVGSLEEEQQAKNQAAEGKLDENGVPVSVSKKKPQS